MSNRHKHDYSEDMFSDTRMTFGEHLEDLRLHLLRAIAGFLIALFCSFFLGKTVLRIISAPVTEQLEAFYQAHAEQVVEDLPNNPKLQEANRPRWVKMSLLRSTIEKAPPAVAPPPEGEQPTSFAALTERAHRELVSAEDALQQRQWNSLTALAGTFAQLAELLSNASEVPSRYSKRMVASIAKELTDGAEQLRAAVNSQDSGRARIALQRMDHAVPLDDVPEQQLVSRWVRIDEPLLFASGMNNALGRVSGRFDLATLSVQEALMAWFKVCIVCGLVLGSPWIFYQIWQFIAAGLYPHEKRLVNVYLPVSVFLFLAGVVICQVFVIPKAIEALLWFNQWIGMTPDLRFNEWLGFAIMMPVVFGISFQLPMVMLFLERIGLFTVETYLRQWKIAFFLIHVFAALITPSVDIISMELLALPMFGLYGLGIMLCKMRPRHAELDIEVPDSEEPVGV